MKQAHLEDLLGSALEDLDIAGGAQVALRVDGETLRAASGLANARSGLEVSHETLFQIGSTTKVFNACLVMKLVESGEVDLDQAVASYLPDLEISPSGRQWDITPRQLLSMSSGIDNGPYHDTGRGDDSLTRYLECLVDLPMIHEPGEGFGYSNASSDVAGRILEVRSQRPWERALSEDLLDPIGLKNTHASIDQIILHPTAVGHAGSRESPEPLPHWGITQGQAPAGSTLCSTASDLTEFASMFLGESAQGSVLSQEVLELMQTPQVRCPTRLMAHDWCLGPYHKVWDEAHIFGHSGTNFSGSSMLLWIPSKRAAIATLTNDPPKGYPLAEHLFREILPEVLGISMPETPQVVSLAQSELDSYVGSFAAHKALVTVTREGHALHLHKRNDNFTHLGGEALELKSLAEPLGEGRFLVKDPLFSGGRDWDVAFWGEDASHLTDGVFTYRQT